MLPQLRLSPLHGPYFKADRPYVQYDTWRKLDGFSVFLDFLGMKTDLQETACSLSCPAAVRLDGGELNVNLQKMKKAETWPAALQGRNAAVDPATLEGMQKKIMLERFQSEVKIVDFSALERSIC